MRHIFLITCLAGVILSISHSFAQSEDPQVRFFESLYDVPIMTGLEEIPELALNFDKPDGRISQASAYTEVLEKSAIFSFYDLSLSQMGWKRVQVGSYAREGEKLEISIEEVQGKTQEKQSGSLLVRFLLKPLK